MPSSSDSPLTVPEAFVLVTGPAASGAQAFKLGLMDLVARGALVMEPDAKLLRDGAQPASSERALTPILDAYRRAPTHLEDGHVGVRVADLARTFGSAKRYVAEDVLPSLEARGLYERKTARVLWIFPTTRWVLTPFGESERSRLRSEHADPGSDDTTDAASFAYWYGGDGGGDIDLSGLGFATMEAFDAALSAIDSAVDAVASSFDGGSSSDAGGSSDGGGGGDSGGGDSGGGGGDSGGSSD